MRFTVLCLVLAGCGLFTGNNDDDQTCPVDGTGGLPEQGYRDPTTGVCEYTVGGGGECTPGCACPDKEPGMGTIAGGECDGPCSDLDEQSCLQSGTCHASYTDNGSGEDSFWSCWDIAPQTPQTSESCPGLDPFTCSIEPICASVFSIDADGNTEFESCITAANYGCDCGSGYYCEQACACPAGSAAGSGCECQPTCVPIDPTCSLTCPSGDVCMESCSADGSCIDSCIPQTQDPGQCSGPVSCNMAPPACPPGTTAGIDNGCYTGYCIPNADCAPEDCASITTEAACTARNDCEAVYTGSNCTCDDSGCTCTTLTFDRCESLASGSGNGSGI
jgi:hypothetical protein